MRLTMVNTLKITWKGYNDDHSNKKKKENAERNVSICASCHRKPYAELWFFGSTNNETHLAYLSECGTIQNECAAYTKDEAVSSHQRSA